MEDEDKLKSLATLRGEEPMSKKEWWEGAHAYPVPMNESDKLQQEVVVISSIIRSTTPPSNDCTALAIDLLHIPLLQTSTNVFGYDPIVTPDQQKQQVGDLRILPGANREVEQQSIHSSHKWRDAEELSEDDDDEE